MFFKKKEVEIVAPVNGKLISLKDVPDPTFSEEMVGKGVAIIPEGKEIYSPVEGKITKVKVKDGEQIKQGDLLLVADLDKLKEKGYRLETPIIICNPDQFKNFTYTEPGNVKKGDVIMKVQI